MYVSMYVCVLPLSLSVFTCACLCAPVRVTVSQPVAATSSMWSRADSTQFRGMLTNAEPNQVFSVDRWDGIHMYVQKRVCLIQDMAKLRRARRQYMHISQTCINAYP